ncbi:MAG: hypothetical protein N2036_13680, partial [Bryobacteraceae bacterium]|nr:hypothetical protein [Bryobacteraceae bacterium]
PAFGPAPSAETVASEMQSLERRAAEAGLMEIASHLAQPEDLAQALLGYWTPPDPRRWAPRFMEQFNRLVMGRVARWYCYPFLHWPEPMELAATVLRLGQPQDYAQAAALALLECRLLEHVSSFEPERLGHYLDTVRVLGMQFEIHFEGYLLRVSATPKLRTAEGWCWYLDALRRIHNSEIPLPELAEFRQDFLGRRGCADTAALLCRLAGGGLVQ